MLLLAACGGPAKPANTPKPIALEPVVAQQTWYRAAQPCGQGPFEVELPVEHAKYGEEIELLVHASHKVALHAVVIADGADVAKIDGVYDSDGATTGKPDNARCVADARERLAIGRAGAAGGSGDAPAGVNGSAAAPASTRVPLIADPAVVPDAHEVIRWTPGPQTHAVKIRLWSIDPNDLDGVRFGAAHVVWRPNVSEAEYDAHLAAEQGRREAEARARAASAAASAKVEVTVEVVDPTAERARLEAEARAAAEAERRRAITAALEAERLRRRAAFCDAHPDDRDCWGPGGRHVVLELEQHARERDAYCAHHGDDARCWSDAERARRDTLWQHRVAAALSPSQPSGPPPAPLAETPPPKLSLHAEWRPGYWQWTESTWVWLAGMWRVPDSDIAAEQTTTAPTAPPPPQAEAPPAAPVRTAVWITGFWQWNGATWVWVAGSWQLRPAPQMTWRAAEWQPRGAVHVLVPGGWVRAR